MNGFLVDINQRNNSPIVGRCLVLGVDLGGVNHEAVPFILQPLLHSHLSRVETLPVMAVDRLRRGGPRGTCTEVGATRTHIEEL